MSNVLSPNAGGSSQKIEIYDVTCRDGTQRPGINVNSEEKIALARLAYGIGVHVVELGYPLSNSEDQAVFRRAGKELAGQEYAAFGMTMKRGGSPKLDVGLKALIESGAPVLTIVGKSSLWQVENILRTNSQENIRIIRESIQYLLNQPAEASRRRVIFDAEHFFDGWKENPDYAIETLQTAVDAGADTIVLCDTKGGAFPREIATAVEVVRREISGNFTIGIHTHNDRGLATANTLEAVLAGARHVQGTWNGIGERVGNANLVEILPALDAIRMPACSPDQLRLLTSTAQAVSKITRVPLASNTPYVGEFAFAHTAGMHTSAVMIAPDAYEFMPPDAVGNERTLGVSKQSGRAIVPTILGKARLLSTDEILKYADASKKQELHIQYLQAIKERESKGDSFERAPASLELVFMRLMEKTFGPDRIQHRDALLAAHQLGGDSHASVKIVLNNQECQGEGSSCAGSFSALDTALRSILTEKGIDCSSWRLVEYVEDAPQAREKGSSSSVRAYLTFSLDGHKNFTTTGSSADATDAAWKALLDGAEYFLRLKEKEKRSVSASPQS